MPEWWTYGLADFLMFSPRTYYRMLERYNEAVWPGQILTLVLGVSIAGLLRRPSARQGIVICAILAALWAWVAGAFLWARYSTINWAVIYLLPLFAIQVSLLVWIGVIQGRLRFQVTNGTAGILCIAIFLLAVVLYPALAPLLGRGWRQAEFFGMSPDPTAVATLGLLLLPPDRMRWVLLMVPVLWCLLSGMTLLAMGSAEAWILLVSPIVVMARARGVVAQERALE